MHRLEAKFVLLSTIVIIVGATIISYIIYAYERNEHHVMGRHRAELLSSVVSGVVASQLNTPSKSFRENVRPSVVDLLRQLSATQANQIRYLMLLDGDLKPVLAYGDSTFRGAMSFAESRSAFERDTVLVLDGFHQQEKVVETYEPIRSAAGRAGLLFLIVSLQREETGLGQLVDNLIAITIVVVIFSILMAVVVARMLAKPVKILAREMELVESPHYETSLSKDRRDELGTLQERFLVMLGRLRRTEEEKEKARSALIQAEKMASIGTLASGIAHEINNPLAGLKQSIHRIRANPENVAQTKKYVALIHNALDHIEDVVKGLLDFSRKRELSLKKIDINDVLKDALRMVAYQVDQNGIDCVENLDKDLPAVMGDAYYLEQVFVNLMLNALDAMPSGGQLTLRSYLADTQTVVEIEDTGSGIEQDQLDQVFDPFFTTKEEGKGTGLGLSISYSIVKEHSGEIKIESRAGVGTKVAIMLPYA